jgi:hypothetical protein
MYAAVPFIVVIAWLTPCYVVLRVRGLRPSTYWGMNAENAVAWRQLRRWQYITIYGVLVYGMALFVFNLTWDYEDGKVNLFYLQEHQPTCLQSC